MKKTDDQAKSIIKGGFLNVKLNKEKNESVLFFNGDTIILGINGIPNILFTSVQLDIDALPHEILNDIREIKKVILIGTFKKDSKSLIEFYKIPNWVNNLVNMEELTLQQIDLTSFKINQ